MTPFKYIEKRPNMIKNRGRVPNKSQRVVEISMNPRNTTKQWIVSSTIVSNGGRELSDDPNEKNLFNQFAETQSAKLALQDIQQRHTQMVEIEKSLVELRDMFVDLSNMVNLQVSAKTPCSLEINHLLTY